MSANRRQEAIVRRIGEKEETVFGVDSPIIATMAASNEQLFIQRFPNVLERIDLKTEEREEFRFPDFNAIFVGDISTDGKTFITGSRNKTTSFWYTNSIRKSRNHFAWSTTLGSCLPASVATGGGRLQRESVRLSFGTWKRETRCQGSSLALALDLRSVIA